MEFQNASVVWPDKVRPDASLIVPETMIGRSTSKLVQDCTHRVQRRLGIQGIEYRFDQNDIDAALDEGARSLGVAATSSSKLIFRSPGR